MKPGWQNLQQCHMWAKLMATANEIAAVTDVVSHAPHKVSFVSSSKITSSSTRARVRIGVRIGVRTKARVRIRAKARFRIRVTETVL
jgi:hypothetical protein